MASPSRRERNDRLFIEANTFTIMDPDVMEDFRADFTETGLVATTSGGAAVLCGLHLGEIDVTAETWEREPPVELDPWQDVAEAPLPWPGERMQVWGAGYGEDEELTIAIPGPGDYRVRVSGRNRDDGEDRDEGDPVERYLVQVWPAPPAPPLLRKATSQTGAYWRSSRGRA